MKRKKHPRREKKKRGLKPDDGAGRQINRKLFAFCALALCYCTVLASARHPFYVSVCTIEHNAKTKALEITFKIFTEDLESALEELGAQRLRLGSEQESPKAERYIADYLKRHVTLQVDGDTVAFSFVGKEIEVDEAWCYVEVVNVPQVSKLTVRNSLLMEKFEAQQNIVHVKVGGKQKSLVLWKDKREGAVEF